MPSGKPIDWSQYDHLLEQHLPGLTIEAWRSLYAPHISAKAIGVRARKTGVEPAKYKPSDAHKKSISNALLKETPEKVEFVRANIDKYSRRKLAEKIGLSPARLNDLINRHDIRLSDEGRKRAREDSRLSSVDRVPWNKGGSLSDDAKEKISVAVSGENNGQYGRGMTEEEKEKWREAYFTHGIHKMRAWLDSDVGIAHQERLKAIRRLPENRRKSSERTHDLIEKGVIKLNRGVASRLKTVKGGEFTTKSSYETRYALQLEADPEVVGFVYEPLRIPYEWDGCVRYYLPDFLVRYKDGREILVEVKPLKLVDLPKNRAKIDAGHGFRFDFVVVTEDDLPGL